MRCSTSIGADGHTIVDLGTDTDAVRIDYPDKAQELGDAILDGRAERGVLVCGSGVGASVAACKLAGIRAAICHDVYSAHQGVEHDDMNVLCLGSEVVGPSLAADLVRAFLGATFIGSGDISSGSESGSDGKADGRWLKSKLHTLSERGQSVWIDYLSRDMLEQGELARMMKEDAVVGVTSNPTIFQKAISHGNAYDEQLKELLGEAADPKEIFLQLSARDVAAALELLAPVHDGAPQDGFVSWEVDPTLAYDREGTFDEAMRLHAWIPKSNLYVKIPATKPGSARSRTASRTGRTST